MIKARILRHDQLGPYTRKLIVEAPNIASNCEPGQFLHLLCGATYDPLLRRPIGIHDIDQKLGLLSMLYEVRGRGTVLLSKRCPGDELDIIGPLGKGFNLPTTSAQPVLLIAGGIGVAPLYFLAQRISSWVGCDKTTFIIGARTASMLMCLDEFSKLGSDIRVATDDGTYGYHGFVSGLLEQYINEIDISNPPLVYACGPMPMLKAVADITKANNLKCQVSTEAKMACGVGACMSCVIKIKAGDTYKYMRSCKEGPVFDADEVIWE